MEQSGYIDIVGPLERTKGGSFVLGTPLKRIDAPTICEELLTCRMNSYQTARGSNFLAKVMQVLLDMLKISHLKTSLYHPQSNGMLELLIRFHATLKSMLRKTCPEPKEWDRWLPYLLFAYWPSNFTSKEEVIRPISLFERTRPRQSVVDFVTETQLRETAKLERKKVYTKRWYDKRARDDPIELGDDDA